MYTYCIDTLPASPIKNVAKMTLYGQFPGHLCTCIKFETRGIYSPALFCQNQHCRVLTCCIDISQATPAQNMAKMTLYGQFPGYLSTDTKFEGEEIYNQALSAKS